MPSYLGVVTVDKLDHPGCGRYVGDTRLIRNDTSLIEALNKRERILDTIAKLAKDSVRVDPSQEVPFVPTDLQQKIMDALYRKRLTTDQLLGAVGCDRKQLFGRWGLNYLMEKGRVKNDHDRKGYYRPDFPPQLRTTPPPP